MVGFLNTISHWLILHKKLKNCGFIKVFLIQMTHYDKALEGKLAPYFKWHMIIFSSHFQTERDEGETFIYLFVWEN